MWVLVEFTPSRNPTNPMGAGARMRSTGPFNTYHKALESLIGEYSPLLNAIENSVVAHTFRFNDKVYAAVELEHDFEDVVQNVNGALFDRCEKCNEMHYLTRPCPTVLDDEIPF